MDLRRGHKHRHYLLCLKCKAQTAIVELVPWDKEECRSEGYYCVTETKIIRCHQCSARRIPIGEYPEHLATDAQLRHDRLERLAQDRMSLDHLHEATP